MLGVLRSQPPDRLASRRARAMDDDKEKSAIEKMIDKVNDAVENIANTASAVAMKAMEPEPDPKQVAGTTSEQV
jgi:hypothetical protein